MKIGLVVQTSEGDRRSTAEFADFVKYEEVHNVSFAKIEDDIKVRDLAWLAWQSERRRKVTTLDFDAWCGTIDGIRLDTGEDKLGPLESGQPTG